MKVSKYNFVPSFKTTYVNISKMNPAQKELGRKVSDDLRSCECYSKAVKELGVDVYILPSGKDGVKAKFMDSKCDMFYKNGSKPLSVCLDAEKRVEPILDVFSGIKKGKFKKVLSNPDEQTDLTKLKNAQLSGHYRETPGTFKGLPNMFMEF